MSYELRIHNYEGPLEKLLQLIEERRMDVTQVSLAAVTDDFLKYLERLRAELKGGPGAAEEDLRLLADFIVVASRLILIKSKSLLPELELSGEEERDIQDLEQRLALYKELKAAQKHIAVLWKKGGIAAARPYFLRAQASLGRGEGEEAAVFYPGSKVTPGNLAAALAAVQTGLQKFILETETIEETVVSLEEKMRSIVARMEVAAEMTLKTLGEGSKSDLIVAFLAVLHLAREELLVLEQAGQFSDIIVRKREML